MKKELLSIVIITCNRKNELIKTIKSCIAFAGMNSEIVVIDNGSKDGTYEVLLDIQKEMTNTDCTLVYHFANENLGVSGGRDCGYKLARSDIVFFIDDDAVLQENSEKLSTGYNFMKAHLDVGALALEIFDNKQKDYLLDFVLQEKIYGYRKVYSYIGCGHFVRKCEFFQYLYPPKLMYGSEERYATTILQDKKMKVLYFNNIKVFHNPSKNTRFSTKEIYQNTTINRYVIKTLILPKSVLPISSLLFGIRCLKMERIDLSNVINDVQIVKQRMIDNKIAEHHIKFSTVKLLVKQYGLFAVI